VFIGLRETGGYCANLKRGFDDLGVRAVFVDLYGHPFEYGQGGPMPWLGRVAARLRGKRRQHPRSAVWVLADRLAATALFAWAVIRFDSFILCSGSSFLGLRDLPILKLLGKRLICVFFGSDSRPSYLNGYELAADDAAELARAVAATAAKRRMLRRIEQYADEIVCHALSAHLHERPVVAFLALGIPYPAAGHAEPESPSTRPIRVLHAPSRPVGKGTAQIRDAIAAVRDEGIELEAVEVIGQPNAVVLAELARCDFVVDALYSDTPMAVLATEAAALGKPSIVGGYGWTELERDTPVEFRPPAHVCHPDDLVGAIRQMATDPGYRVRLGQSAREFVVSRWSPALVAERYLRLVDSDAAEWRFVPKDIRYIHGTGLSENRLRAILRGVLAGFGRAGLQVDDKPELEERMAAFAFADDVTQLLASETPDYRSL
jgi:hypothetical protein